MYRLFEHLSFLVARKATAARLSRLRMSLAAALFALSVPLLALPSRAATGSVIVPGGGEVSFVNAAEVTTNETDKSVILKFVAPDPEAPVTDSPSFTFPGITSARILAVGGGGGGGGVSRRATTTTQGGAGAGGGAGGFVEVTNLFGAATYTVKVGAGGEAGGNSTSPSAASPGTNGDPTTIKTNGVAMLTALGGGGGGGQCAGLEDEPGKVASGGGGSRTSSPAADVEGGKGTPGWGNDGGKGDLKAVGAGGGGAGGKGQSAKDGGAGGAGLPSDITGEGVEYAVGGGGGKVSGKVNGETSDTPGSGGGGGGNTGVAKSGADGQPGVVYVRILGSVSGDLEKPQDRQFEWNGDAHFVVEPSPFIEVTDNGPFTDVGIYTATAKPAEGLKWSTGSNETVTVTLVITEQGSKSGDEIVTGAHVTFAGAVTNYWVYNPDTKTNDLVIGFSNVGAFTLPGSSSARILAVGGGGGGGGVSRRATTSTEGGAGAGGGAGGFVEVTNLFGAATYTVNVGAGGEAGGNSTSPSAASPGDNGQPTTITTNGVAMLTALGGGGGGGQCAGQTNEVGFVASGGGGSRKSSPASDVEGGKGTPGQGNDGGKGDLKAVGAGGGGAGGKGQSAKEGGAGGAGLSSDIAGGDSITYAVGGGGGKVSGKVNGETSDTPGSGGGGGGNTGVAKSGAAGKPGIVWVRISSAMNGEFKRPEQTTVYTYDGTEKVSITDTIFYRVDGVNSGTTAGVYVSWAVLNPGVVWPGGGTEYVTNTMTIKPCAAVFSDLRLELDGRRTNQWEYLQVKLPEPKSAADPEWVTPNYEWRAKDDEPGAWKPWSEISNTAVVGEYLLRVGAPTNGNFTFDYVSTNFFITNIRVEIRDLRQRNWMVGDPNPPEPTFTVIPAWVKEAEYLGVWYAPRVGGDASAVTEWSRERPTEIGHYWVKVDVLDKGSFDCKPAYAEFDIVNGLGAIFSDYVEITIGSHVPDLTNFPWLVTLCETNPPGFLYSRAGRNGNDMSFTDSTGTNVLSYAVETWDTNGVSEVYVRIPLVTNGVQTIRLYWHVREEASVPAHHPEEVWQGWTREQWETQWPSVIKPAKPYSPVSRDGYLVNYWTQQPKIEPEFWTVEDGKKGRYGTLTPAVAAFLDDKVKVDCIYTNVLNHTGYATMPTTNAGSFRVVYVLNDPEGLYEPMEAHVDYAISGSTSFDDLKGGAKSLTLSGRVMLANDDLFGGTDPNAAHAVTDQSYWQTREVTLADGTVKTNDVFWTHEGETTYSGFFTDLQTNHIHRLHFMGDDGKTNTLWRFENVRFGVCGYGTTWREGYYYLPWSPTSLAISSYDAYAASKTDTTKQGQFPEVGNIVMRNTYDEVDEGQWAVVYSPCYTNGIGTIYFDAVNSQRNNLESFRLVVEVAEGYDVTDESAEGPDENGGHIGLGKIGKDRWKPYPILSLAHKGEGSAFVANGVSNELALEIEDTTAYKKVDNFYRACVKVNVHGSCRFRIRRTASVTTVASDEARFIILDNILVSYPNMSADLYPFGKYDADRAGKQILGVAGAMSVPFPAAGQDGVKARAWAETHVNDFDPTVTPESVIIRAQMYYRWRYLDQAYDPVEKPGKPLYDASNWNVAELWPADGLKAREPLKIPNDEGDLEFWYRADINSPAYDYFDYSGAGLYLNDANEKPLYVDQQCAVTNRIRLSEYVSREGETLPSAGTNWFVRLRAGRSDWEGIRVITEQGGSIETNEMEVIGDGLWRACVKTPADTGTLRYRFEPVNRQTPGSTGDYAENVENWCAKDALTELPNTIALDKSAGPNAWAKAPCDAKTGYVMFRIDERKESVYVARADWQDFNRWVTAVNDRFVGNVTDTNSTTYVAQQLPIEWSQVTPSAGTNKNWLLDFSVGTGQVPRRLYPRNDPFEEWYVNGWTAHNGMWTYGQYAKETEKDEESSGDKTALQLEGCGRGLMEMIGATSAPNGIDTVLYTARVAQFNEFEDFTCYDGAFALRTPIQSMGDIILASELTNVTFVTTALMSEKGLAAFDGDASLSLVANYTERHGGYEFRVSLGRSTGDLRLELYRWAGPGKISATPLGTNYVKDVAKHLIGNYEDNTPASSVMMGRLFISTRRDASGVSVKAGVALGQVAQGSAALSSAANFATVSYYDTSADAANLKRGSVGVLTRNCPGMFENPTLYLTPVAPKGDAKNANKFLSSDSESISSLGNAKPLLNSDAEYLDARTVYENWNLKSGRMNKLSINTLHGGHYGFEAVKDVKQKVAVETTDQGEGRWGSDAVTNSVIGFKDQVFTNIVRSTRKSDVRLKVLGTASDARTDVVINSIELTQWSGQSTPGLDDSTFYGYTNRWVYTSAWANEYIEGESTNRTIALQPARATSAANPVSVRSPMMNGFGLLHFAWKNADTAHAKVRVQIATNNVTRNTFLSLTKAAPDSVQWTDVGEPITFSEPEGEKTVYVNERYPAHGAIRLVVDRAVTAAALQVTREEPEYGLVELTDIYAWDLPAYDMHSWIGWNFRAQGWDGTEPGAWANLSDGGSEHGLSGLLNNSLTDLAKGDATDYASKLPHVQSPTFGTNSIGAVDFRARLYGKDDLVTENQPAVVTIYGATKLTPMGHEPTAWTKVVEFPVSNGFYKTFTQLFKPSEQFYAIRFAVRGMPEYEPGSGEPKVDPDDPPLYDPPLRVAIDDICIYERPMVSLRFRKLLVRPFRNAESIKSTEKVRDIDSVNEQPLAGEAFGFQAEVEVESEEIPIDDPKKPLTVDLWYYPKDEPWGFANWKGLKDAVHVTLDRADGEKLVFRSTVDNSLSICPMQEVDEGKGYKLVQYQMVAHYYDTEETTPYEYEMSEKDWSMPSWNSGFADPNAQKEKGFSGFTVLEEIAPKRAWINEVNLCEDPSDAAKKDQWVEIAVPSGVDMTGWKLQAYNYSGEIVTSLLRFGSGTTPKSKTDPLEPSHYAFYVVKSPQSTLSADATWPKYSGGTMSDGYLNRTYPYGFELVRPTGVVEHRVVVQGWNQYKDEGYRDWPKYSGTNLVAVLSAKTKSDDWVWAEEDYHLFPGSTVGVTNSYGGVHEDWHSPMGRTPGAKNEGQYIDPNWFVYPNGGYYRVIATVLGPHMRQILGGETNTFARLTVQEGATTNILYEVDRWYEMGNWTVTPQGGSMSGGAVGANRKTYYTLTLANVSNQTEVTVDETISRKLVDAGLDDTNPYRNAILRWLEAKGDEFAGDEIVPGEFRGYDGALHLPLDLTHLYWLGLDPTLGGWELWGGMGEKGGTQHLGPVISSTNRVNASGLVHTNILTTCWLMITNANDAAFAAYPPNNLQGLANEQSSNFSGSWTSETFKITMQMANESKSLVSQFHPMRQFVFGPGSFRPADDPVAPFAARIEITDPFSRQSPAWEWGWWKYADRGISPFTRFRLDGDINPSGVSTLKNDDLLTW